MEADYKLALKEYGLTDNEITVYITLLKLSESSAQLIAKYSKIPRTTCYHILESLMQKGLVSYVLKDKKQNFQAVEPQIIIKLLNEKKKVLESAMPELMGMISSIKEKPSIKVFEGNKGIKSVLQNILEEKKIIYHYGDIISLQNSLPYIFPQYIVERVSNKIPIKIICKKEEAHEDLLRNSKKQLREFVFIPDNYNFKSSVFIYSNKVAIFNLQKEPYYAIVIENEDFYNTQKNMFDLLWNSYKN